MIGIYLWEQEGCRSDIFASGRFPSPYYTSRRMTSIYITFTPCNDGVTQGTKVTRVTRVTQVTKVTRVTRVTQVTRVTRVTQVTPLAKVSLCH